MKGVVSNEQRHEQMAIALKQGYPMLEKRKGFLEDKLTIVAYGPSLRETWRQIRWLKQPILTVSGAHGFLIERGITPDCHVDMDPRPHKAQLLKCASDETFYLMASCCHPDFWELLNGHEVHLWHLINGDDLETVDWVQANHPEGSSSMIGGGSSVGQRAMNVAAALGYRRFDVFGMDCSFGPYSQHAGWHPNPALMTQPLKVGNKVFDTSPQMVQAAKEMEIFLRTMDVEVMFHGEGLMQHIAREVRRSLHVRSDLAASNR